MRIGEDRRYTRRQIRPNDGLHDNDNTALGSLVPSSGVDVCVHDAEMVGWGLVVRA